jgi:hypothetical protein
MGNWRFSLHKLSATEVPITADLLSSNGLSVGDYVSSKEDLKSKDDEMVFLGGKTYEVLVITKSPMGITVSSEQGPWFFPFPDSGQYFMSNFVKIDLSEEDILSERFDVIPFEILSLLNEHGQLLRANIRKEMIAQGFDSKIIQSALVYLEKHGYVRSGLKLGTVLIAEKGLKLLEGKS